MTKCHSHNPSSFDKAKHSHNPSSFDKAKHLKKGTKRIKREKIMERSDNQGTR